MEAELIILGLFTAEDVKNQDAETPLFKKYFMHGVAHPIGLDVHDVGSKYAPFDTGYGISPASLDCIFVKKILASGWKMIF